MDFLALIIRPTLLNAVELDAAKLPNVNINLRKLMQVEGHVIF